MAAFLMLVVGLEDSSKLKGLSLRLAEPGTGGPQYSIVQRLV